MKPESIRKFASLVKDLRLSMGLSQQAFADRIGLTQASLYAWEAAKIKTEPKAKYLRVIANLKGWSFNELMEHLEGKSAPPDAISMPALREAIKKLSLSEALEIGRLALSRAENYTNNNILLLERNGNVKSFSKGDNMTIAQLLQKFIASTPAPRLEQLLQELDYSREWLEALAAGTQPSDNDLDQIGLLLDSAEFTDDEGNAYFIERLEMMRGAPLDCRHHHAPNETVS